MSRISMDCLFGRCLRGIVILNFTAIPALFNCTAFQQNTRNHHSKAPDGSGALRIVF
jgi:hypothetical protein